MSNFQKYSKDKVYSFFGSLFLVLVVGASFFYFKDNFKPTDYETIPNKTDMSSLKAEDIYTEKVQKIFNNRCVACHGCYESPCQLNLQSYDGLARGVHPDYVFDRSRSDEAQPTRLYEDANTVEQWRLFGFKDVIGKDEPEYSVLSNALKATLHKRKTPEKIPLPEDYQCILPQTADLAKKVENDGLGMPYNLPSLPEQKINEITDWVKNGAKPPPAVDLVERNPHLSGVIKAWQDFLNIKDYKHKLTSRYLYEHLYLAHFYITDSTSGGQIPTTRPQFFYRLIRSKTSCDSPEMIPTRTANADPLVADFQYCIVKYPATIVNKTHLPYEISLAKVNWLHNLFIAPKWEVSDGVLPAYQKDIPMKRPEFHTYENKNLNHEYKDDIELNKSSSNPFFTFKNIPQESRYRFLLEDAYFHVMTFMKGPSCNGTMAVNAIQDRFFVFFMTPEWDKKINTPDVLAQHQFPGRYGAEVQDKKISAYLKQVKHRNKSRKIINKNLEKEAKNGLNLDAIWDGDRTRQNEVYTLNNPSAALTIFRHNDSASVERGAVGDLTKTAFVMDYSTLERMVYDLVVNFDVFGTFGHMMLTRTYMGLIRTDAEDAYLSFLPQADRLNLKKSWYNSLKSNVDWKQLRKKSLLDKLGQEIMNKIDWTNWQQGELYDENRVANIGSLVEFKSATSEEKHFELIQKILFERLGQKNNSSQDKLNLSTLKKIDAETPNNDPLEKKLIELTQKVKDKKQPFPFFFPEISYIVLGNKNPNAPTTYQKFYTLIHNREFNSISLIVGEDYHHTPEHDTLVLSSKVIGYYPNQFFYVEANQASVDEFVKDALALGDRKANKVFLNKYAVRRTGEGSEIWNIYDFIVDQYHKTEPIGAGYLDLSRYNY